MTEQVHLGAFGLIIQLELHTKKHTDTQRHILGGNCVSVMNTGNLGSWLL